MSERGKSDRGRVGDETLARIDELADGWSVPKGARPPEEEDIPTTRVAALAEREVEEAAKGEQPAPASPTPRAPRRAKGPTKPPPPPRKKGPTKPPPAPPARRKAVSQAPPVPPPGRARPSSPPPAPKKAPAVEAKLPEPAVVVDQGEEDEETVVSDLDAPVADLPVSAAPAHPAFGTPTGTVRLPDSLPRKSGVLGDIGYLFRVMRKRRDAAREVERIDLRITTEKEARNIKLLEMARSAIGDPDKDQTFVGRAREELLEIEEKRSVHAGKAAADEEAIAVIERERVAESEAAHAESQELKKDVGEIVDKLGPLQKKNQKARQEAGKLRRQLADLDRKIGELDASLVAVGSSTDKATVQADMASLKAERQTLAADEPAIAARIDELEPAIASLQARQKELEARIETIAKDEKLAAERAEERIAALRAGQAVEQRAVKDQSARRQEALLGLGEELHHRRPGGSDGRIQAVEKHDLEIGVLERRKLELSELLDTVERAPLIRARLYLFLLVAALGAGVYFLLLR